MREVGFMHKSLLLPICNGRLVLELLSKFSLNAHLLADRPMMKLALVVSFCHVMRRLHRINKRQPSDIAAKSRLGGCESSRNTAFDARRKVHPKN